MSGGFFMPPRVEVGVDVISLSWQWCISERRKWCVGAEPQDGIVSGSAKADARSSGVGNHWE